MTIRVLRRGPGIACGLACLAFAGTLAAQQPDPFAANNTVYPSQAEWSGAFRPSNYDYPPAPVQAEWPQHRPKAQLSKQNALAYAMAMKDYIAKKDIKGLVNDPMKWSPLGKDWYDMPWGGQGAPMANGKIDPESGREALLGSYTGQVLQPDSYPPGSRPPKQFQNHAVVYYNGVAAAKLGQIWRNPFKPDVTDTEFPEGSIVVKVEGATLTPEQWPVLRNSTVSVIYRLPVDALSEPDPNKRVAAITPMRFLQMAVRVKDKVASPQTGWVFIAYAYDAGAPGETAWDRAIPIGVMWGNDPKLAGYPDGLGPNGVLQETWVNPRAPEFVKYGLGWGGRLAGPLDVGIRHNAVTVSGQRFGTNNPLHATSCVSCHSAAQYPFVANLYPSPNMVFPPEGQPFLFFDPGSKQWANWFQNRPGKEALSGKGRKGIVGVDYDMMLTFALMRANGSASTDAFIRAPMAGH